MTTKQYLSQAFYLDKQIESKLQQMDSLNALATKATMTLSDMPKNPNKPLSRMEDTVVKIVDLQEEISKDMEKLVDIKEDIVNTIKGINEKEIQTLLEKRYLCFEDWEQIAVDLKYNIRHVYRIHSKGLKKIHEILKSCQ